MSREFPDVDFLGHIRDAIEKIQRYTRETGEAEFLRNEIIQDAVIRNLEVVGEAVTKLSAESGSCRHAHPATSAVFDEIAIFTVQRISQRG